MRTEQEWAKFAKHVQVGARVRWTYEGDELQGVLLENYPHIEKANPGAYGDTAVDLLQVRFDDNSVSSILADYEYFKVAGDDEWYRFDDIIMFMEEETQS